MAWGERRQTASFKACEIGHFRMRRYPAANDSRTIALGRHRLSQDSTLSTQSSSRRALLRTRALGFGSRLTSQFARPIGDLRHAAQSSPSPSAASKNRKTPRLIRNDMSLSQNRFSCCRRCATLLAAGPTSQFELRGKGQESPHFFSSLEWGFARLGRTSKLQTPKEGGSGV